LHIKRRCASNACGIGVELRQFMLQDASGRWKHHVWCGCGDDDQINVLGAATGGLECTLGGLEPQIAAAHIVCGKVTRTDTGALNDPFI
jgi:hypothetical protein